MKFFFTLFNDLSDRFTLGRCSSGGSTHDRDRRAHGFEYYGNVGCGTSSFCGKSLLHRSLEILNDVCLCELASSLSSGSVVVIIVIGEDVASTFVFFTLSDNSFSMDMSVLLHSSSHDGLA
jgi:hypothetical protein